MYTLCYGNFHQESGIRMKNFLIGLGLGLAGVTAFIVFGILGSMKQMGEHVYPTWPWVFVGLGALIALGGPLWFWLITPLRNRLARRSPGRT